MFRAPTAAEACQIAVIIAQREGDVTIEWFDFVLKNCIVRDDYCTDGPGYHGHVFIVQHGGGPDALDVFIVDEHDQIQSYASGYLRG